MSKCPKCGAEYSAGDDCQNRFNLCLALEYENPTAYGAVHHLTVLCYMLQHNEYSHQVWLESREMLREFVEQGTSPAEMRARNRGRVDSGKRNWRITRGPKFSRFADIRWTRTIADVQLDNAEDYCADVRLWAESLLRDTQPCINIDADFLT